MKDTLSYLQTPLIPIRQKLNFSKDQFTKMPAKTRIAFLKSFKETLESEINTLDFMKSNSKKTAVQESESIIHKHIEIKRYLFLKKADLTEKLDNVKVVFAMKDWLFRQKKEKVEDLAGLLNDALLEHIDYNEQNQTYKLFSNSFVFKSFQKTGKIVSN